MEQEVQAGECLAVDGKTVIDLQAETNRGGRPIATEALDPSIRPPSNFNARTDPFEVNGGEGSGLNPGGDLNSAYWLMRYLPERGPGEAAVSPLAREHMPVGGPPPQPDGPADGQPGGDDAGITEDAADGNAADATQDFPDGSAEEPGGGGGCSAGRRGTPVPVLLWALAAAVSVLSGRRTRLAQPREPGTGRRDHAAGP